MWRIRHQGVKMPSIKITETAIERNMKVATYYTDTMVSRLQMYMGIKAPV